ncbi:hypothetical protein QCA50_017497 [Cerrena zonata]|uniref:ATP-dependent DNA ligase family profile domain-containing protein n=1 Tax=Cerrena zonata TaxID=2478898 RepID=A0AAW0FPM1_9APHY
MSVHTEVPFDLFVNLLQQIATVPRKPLKSSTHSADNNKISKIVDVWTKNLHDLYSPLPMGTASAFFRLFFPEEDSGRRYGLQEIKLGEIIAETLGVSTEPQGRGWPLLDWRAESAIGCLGAEVKNIMEETSDITVSNLSLIDVDNLLTELSCSCGFTALSIRSSVHQPRPRRVILQELYCDLSPQAGAVVTQIILRDLRPLLYPLEETHYSASLLQYNTKSITMVTPWDFLKSWDRSGRLLQAYKLHGSLEAATEYLDNPELELVPQIGLPITIPKCLKGQGCVQSLNLLRNSRKVWAETKYDGERAQIHVEVVNDHTLDSRITIFSKSKRESTLDRIAIHSIIHDALGLPQRSNANPSACNAKIKRNIILEAEMVAFSKVQNRIDEFWRIRSLVGSTAYGARHRKVAHCDSQEEVPLSQCSMISDASDGDTRHLALVFFDILMVDSTPLIQSTYAERRKILESTIITRYGYSMLAERKAISMDGSPNSTSVGLLEDVFAKLIASHEEGAVLKGEEGRYRDRRFPWVKLKKDYIPGHGDTVDLALIGASWDKERARELGVSPTVYTTFYLGALRQSDDNVSPGDSTTGNYQVIPHFEVFFTCAYLPSREKLEELNFMIKSSDLVQYGSHTDAELPYTFKLFKGLRAPQVLLSQPLLVEVYGAGFTKAHQCMFYEIRFPRISKVYRLSERSALESGNGGGTTLQELQTLARESVGNDPPGKEEIDFCKTIWGKSGFLSPGIRSDSKRKQREEEWIDKLRVLDEKALGRKVKRIRPEAQRSSAGGDENHELVLQRHPARLGITTGLRAMGSVTNLDARTPTPPPVIHSSHLKQNITPPALLNAISVPNDHQLPINVMESGLLSPANSQLGLRREDTILDLATFDSVMPASEMIEKTQLDLSTLDQVFNAHNPSSRQTPLVQFLQDAVVWLARPSDSPRPRWRLPSHHVISRGQRVHTLESFLAACGWTSEEYPTDSCEWATKGVIFVDDQDGSKQWTQFPLGQLLERRQAQVKSVIQPQKESKIIRKPVYVFSMEILSRELLDADLSDIDTLALCRLG